LPAPNQAAQDVINASNQPKHVHEVHEARMDDKVSGWQFASLLGSM
jgi:hypothetical protein